MGGYPLHSGSLEIFDSDFTESNFGFRKEKSQRHAIKYVQNMVKEGIDIAVGQMI